MRKALVLFLLTAPMLWGQSCPISLVEGGRFSFGTSNLFESDLYTLSLLHFNGNINDDKGGITWGISGVATISPTVYKFGTGAYYLGTSTADCVSTPDSASWTLDTQDFCIEGWIRPELVTNQPYLYRQYQDANNYTALGIFFSGVDCFYFFQVRRASVFLINVGGSAVLAADAWHHYSVSREGTTIRFFLDGFQTDTDTYAGSISDITGDIQTGYGKGYIDDFHVIVGAPYRTSDFAVPTTEAVLDASPYSIPPKVSLP